MGVNCIKVYVRKEEYIYPLKETLQTVGCLDKDLIANLILFNETHAAEFLDSIFKANAIVPVKTTKNKVTYAFAKKNKKNYYLCFSSLKEFEEWKKSSNNDYRPLLISFERYYLQIAKNGGDLLFNPLSIKTIIPRKHIRIK